MVDSLVAIEAGLVEAAVVDIHLYVDDIIGLDGLETFKHLYVYDIIGLDSLETQPGELESQPPSLNKFTSDKNSGD